MKKLKKFYQDRFHYLDPLLCSAIAAIGLALDFMGVFIEWQIFTDAKNHVFASLVGGLLSALGFLVAAQSIVFTMTPRSVIRKLRLTKGGRALSQLQKLFNTTALALGLGILTALLGQLLYSRFLTVFLGWATFGLVLFLSIKIWQIIKIITDIGKRNFEQQEPENHSPSNSSSVHR